MNTIGATAFAECVTGQQTTRKIVHITANGAMTTMNNYKFSTRSLNNLRDVHPDLIAVMRLALSMSWYDFGITEGVRGLDRQRLLYEQKKSRTIHKSKHLIQPDGFGHAVDIAIYHGGEVSWNITHYEDVAGVVKKAAASLGVEIKWGGDFDGIVDGPHFEVLS